jgi:tRNA pseudouridine55 synthase
MHAPRTRVQRRPVHGVLLLDKPLGLSSNTALQRAKWLLRAEKAGHTGTLDPLATGVLPLCFGAATKFSQLHLDANKTYLAQARLGVKTNTADAEGEVIAQREVNVSAADLQRVCQAFHGALSQVPPMHSALKKDGKPLYEYARAGLQLERAVRPITIHALNLTLTQDAEGFPAINIEVSCSKGTYIRTLAEDIGEALGCGAHVRTLRRIRTGPFDLADCITLDEMQDLSEAQRMARLKSVQCLLQDHTIVTLDEDNAGRFLSGVRRRGDWPDAEKIAVYGQTPKALLGTAHVKAGELIANRLLSPPEIKQILTSS